MADDLPRLTVTILLVLVVVISVVGTWVLLSELSTIEPQQSFNVDSQSGSGSGRVELSNGQPIVQTASSQGKISLIIEEEV